MIYLSAQPDEFYFLWQLQLQVYNFKELGIPSQSIHILIAFDPLKGLNEDYKNWIFQNQDASFFIYPDTRSSSKYLSSIRPHIIAKHIAIFPHLEESTIFYHDSDIVFSMLPDFEGLNSDETWYTSDTRGYLDTNYIVNAAGEAILEEMCNIVGIHPKDVTLNNHNAGGAQYLLKKCPLSFWQKVEGDCECLYNLLENHNTNLQDSIGQTNNEIQSWCADMWAIWWNALLLKRKFEIHKELDFSWANSPIELWTTKKILHYTGSVGKNDNSVFCKSDYVFYSPFTKRFPDIDTGTCSYPLIKLIDDYTKSQINDRKDFSNVTFIIIAQTDSDSTLNNLKNVINSLIFHLNTNIKLLEIGKLRRVRINNFVGEVQYSFSKRGMEPIDYFSRFDQLIDETSTPTVVIYDANVVLSLEYLTSALTKILEAGNAVLHLFSNELIKVDRLSTAIFSKILDPVFLEQNRLKYHSELNNDRLGAVFINKKQFSHSSIKSRNIFHHECKTHNVLRRAEDRNGETISIAGNTYLLR